MSEGKFILVYDKMPPKTGDYKIKIVIPEGIYGSGVKEIKAYWNGRGFINFNTYDWNYYDYVAGWYENTEEICSCGQPVHPSYDGYCSDCG